MQQLARLSLVLSAVCLLAAVAWSARSVDSQEVTPVRVVNLPAEQTVRGTVEVGKPISHSRSVERRRIVVPPSARDEAGSLVEAGLVETDGFRHAVLSLAGRMQGRLSAAGVVGALLVPDREGVLEALVQDGAIHFPLEAAAEISRPEGGRFAVQAERTIAFPRYRIYFYNSTSRSAEVDLYLYLTH